jgi:hypothetical protein
MLAAYPNPPSNLFAKSAQPLGFTRTNRQQVGTYDGKWQVKGTTKSRNKLRDAPGPLIIASLYVMDFFEPMRQGWKKR